MTEPTYRPADQIEPHEWARLERARRTTDPRKLHNLLPGWLRGHINRGKMPAPFRPDFRVVVDQLGIRQSDPWSGRERRAPDYYDGITTAEYVRDFEQLNMLRPVTFRDPEPAPAKPHKVRHKPQREFDRFAALPKPKPAPAPLAGRIRALKAHVTMTERKIRDSSTPSAMVDVLVAKRDRLYFAIVEAEQRRSA